MRIDNKCYGCVDNEQTYHNCALRILLLHIACKVLRGVAETPGNSALQTDVVKTKPVSSQSSAFGLRSLRTFIGKRSLARQDDIDRLENGNVYV